LIKIKGALIKKDLGFDCLARVLVQDHALPQSFPVPDRLDAKLQPVVTLWENLKRGENGVPFGGWPPVRPRGPY
jgi:hypothetical protein